MGIRTSFLGLGKATSIGGNITFRINTYLGPLHIDDPTQESPLSKAPPSPRVCFKD